MMHGASEKIAVSEAQRKRLERFFDKLSTPHFFKIEMVISKLQQLFDLCRIDYVTPLRCFDPAFDLAEEAGKDNPPEFRAAALPGLGAFIQDFYYLGHDFSVSKSMAYAMVALYELRPNKGEHPGELVDHLRTVNSILKHRLNTAILLNFYRILQDNPKADMKKARIRSDSLAIYIANITAVFKSNQRRIQYELVNEEMAAEIPRLFDNQPMEDLAGYNVSSSTLLQTIFETAFYWVIPLQVLNKFTELYFSENVRTLLEDFYQNGLFWNHNYQKSFSLSVAQCSRTRERIALFEHSFMPGGENYDVITAIQETDVYKRPSAEKMTLRIHGVNDTARLILEEETMRLFSLHEKIKEIFDDMKKKEPAIISNLRMLVLDNIEKKNQLESEMPKWALFFDLIQHYTTISPLSRG
ncbi:MAG: DUF5312 family protein, partial [Spirochaetaceae bacterium]|jgi:hypothetical protein|nr:DUF5312 family protein [Spirochaetaceae bacterium]